MHGTLVMIHKRKILFSIVVFFFILCSSGSLWAKDILYVTNSDTNILSIIDGDKGLVTKELQVGSGPCDVIISHDKKWIAVSHEKKLGEIWFLDRKSLKVLHKSLLTENIYGRTHCFFMLNNKYTKKLYAINQYSGFLYIIDTQSGAVKKTIHFSKNSPQRFGAPVLTNDGNFLFIPDEIQKKILVLNISQNFKQHFISIDGIPSAIALSKNEKKIFVVDGEHSNLNILSRFDNKLIKKIPLGNHPVDITISPNGKYLYISNKMSYSITVVNTNRKIRETTIPVGSYPIMTAVNQNGSRIFVCNYNENTVSIINAHTNREISRVPTASPPIRLAVFSIP